MYTKATFKDHENSIHTGIPRKNYFPYEHYILQCQTPMPLNEEEKGTVEKILAKHLANQEIVSLVENGRGELFSFYDNPEHPIILNGSTKLPVDLFPDEIDDFIYVAEHWFDLLSELKNAISNAEWHVTLDDKPLFWNEEDRKYEHPAEK